MALSAMFLVVTLWFELCTTLLGEGSILGLPTNCSGSWHALIETKDIIPNQTHLGYLAKHSLLGLEPVQGHAIVIKATLSKLKY